jgi:hypothetical protein
VRPELHGQALDGEARCHGVRETLQRRPLEQECQPRCHEDESTRRNEADRTVQPEQGAALVVVEIAGRQGGEREAGVAYHGRDPGHREHHRHETEVLGQEQPGEDEHGNGLDDEPAGLAGDGDQCASNGDPTLRARRHGVSSPVGHDGVASCLDAHAVAPCGGAPHRT